MLGPERWEKGKVYVDEQTYKMPDDVTGPTVTIYTSASGRATRGCASSAARTTATTAPSSARSRRRRAEEPTSTRRTSVPALTVNKLAKNDDIKVDGKGDEPEWGGAASTGPFVNVGTGKPNTAFPVDGLGEGRSGTTRTSTSSSQVQEADFYTGFTDAKAQPNDFTAAGQPKLWTKDTVEMMVEPDAVGSNTNYYELQINPQNKVFKSQFDTLQQPNGGAERPLRPRGLGPEAQERRVDPEGRRRQDDRVHGRGGHPVGGVLEGREPSAEAGRGLARELLRDEGERRRGVVAHPGAGNFHKASRFGKITWVGARGACSGRIGVRSSPGRGVDRRHGAPHHSARAHPAATADAVRRQSGRFRGRARVLATASTIFPSPHPPAPRPASP